MADAMDLSKAEVVGLFGQMMQETAAALGCKADNEAILLAVHELTADRDAQRGRADREAPDAGR